MGIKQRKNETLEEFQARRQSMLNESWEDRAHRHVPEIRSYGDAWDHWERKGDEKPRQNGDRYLGKHGDTYRTMRVNDDDSISFFYKGDHMITYHTDDTVSLNGLADQANADPANRVFPRGVHWWISGRAGPCISSAQPSVHGGSWWQTRYVDSPTGKRVPNPDMLVVRGAPDKPVRMALVDGRWEPTDLDQLEPFRWTAYDRKAARGASDKQGIPDFVAALDAYLTLGAELPPYVPASDAELLSRLRARDFAGVMAGMPRNAQWSTWVPGQQRQRLGDTVKPSALAKLRTQAIVEAGATFVKEQKLLTYPEYLNVETQLKRFGTPN